MRPPEKAVAPHCPLRESFSSDIGNVQRGAGRELAAVAPPGANREAWLVPCGGSLEVSFEHARWVECPRLAGPAEGLRDARTQAVRTRRTCCAAADRRAPRIAWRSGHAREEHARCRPVPVGVRGAITRTRYAPRIRLVHGRGRHERPSRRCGWGVAVPAG